MTRSQRARIVIVNFNAGDWLQRSVKSALEHSEALITVVDNASSDGSVEAAQKALTDGRVTWSVNKDNLGFAAANNQVLRDLKEDYAVLMNPDCELEFDSLEKVLTALEADPKLGLASCRILNEDGSLQSTCRRRFPTPWSAFVRMSLLGRLFPKVKAFQNFDYGDQTIDTENVELVEAISGAFMVAKREAIEEVGLLDEAYFMHCEDLDWCKRFQLKGWKVGFVGAASVIHAKGVSSKARPIRVLWTLHKGMQRFFSKFYRDQYSLPLRAFVSVGIWVSFTGRAALSFASSRGGR